MAVVVLLGVPSRSMGAGDVLHVADDQVCGKNIFDQHECSVLYVCLPEMGEMAAALHFCAHLLGLLHANWEQR